MQYYLPLALLLNALIFASAGAQTSEAPTYYQDCAVLDFGEQDLSTMTEAEKIQALDDSLFGALNQSEECMNAAAQSSAQSVAKVPGKALVRVIPRAHHLRGQALGSQAHKAALSLKNHRRIHKQPLQVQILQNSLLEGKRKVEVQRYVTP